MTINYQELDTVCGAVRITTYNPMPILNVGDRAYIDKCHSGALFTSRKGKYFIGHIVEVMNDIKQVDILLVSGVPVRNGILNWHEIREIYDKL